jgi:acetyltransferase-like isoleucine patch superfamily enzyme
MSLSSWIRRRESPVADLIYRSALSFQRLDIPPIPLFHRTLLLEREFRRGVLRRIFGKAIRAPLLRLYAASVGRSLTVDESLPKIVGTLRIELGDRVSLSGNQVWFACGDASEKRLVIGNDSYVGFGTEIFSGSEVRIGNHVLIANYVLINGYDGHPLDPIRRANGEKAGPDRWGPIVIEDYAWIGSRAVILKNVRVGRGAVIATGAVVTKDVPELHVVAGNPARTVKIITRPPEWNTDR